VETDLELTQLPVVERIIRASWSHETAWDPSSWSPEIPESGQCWSTAYVIRAIFGGEIVHAEVLPSKVPKEHHAWNRLPDATTVDLTRAQFGPAQQFRECTLPESLIMSVAGVQAQCLLGRVEAGLRVTMTPNNSLERT